MIVEEKQKLYLNAIKISSVGEWFNSWRETKVVFKYKKEKWVRDFPTCWRETKVVFKCLICANCSSHDLVEEKQKLYLNYKNETAICKFYLLKRNKSCI